MSRVVTSTGLVKSILVFIQCSILSLSIHTCTHMHTHTHTHTNLPHCDSMAAFLMALAYSDARFQIGLATFLNSTLPIPSTSLISRQLTGTSLSPASLTPSTTPNSFLAVLT